MKSEIAELKRKVKTKDKKLFNLISSLNDNLIIQNYGAIVKYLEDYDDEKKDYTVEFFIDKNELNWNYIPKSNQAKLEVKINEIKKNYLLPFSNKYEYLLEINEIYNMPERKEIIEELKKIINSWNDIKSNKNIWLYGPNNIGKTHIIKSFANLVAKKDYTVSFLFVPELIANLKFLIKGYDTGEEINSLLCKAKDASLLILDDISAAAITPWIRDTFLLPIIEDRIINYKSTIYTSNISIDDYGRRISLSNTPQEDKVAANRIVSKLKQKINIIKLEK